MKPFLVRALYECLYYYYYYVIIIIQGNFLWKGKKLSFRLKRLESSLKSIIKKKKIGYNIHIYGYQVQIFPLTVPQFSKWIFESHFNIEHTRYGPRRLGTQTGCGGIKMPLLSYWIRAKKCVTDYNQGYSRVSQITKRGKLDMRSFSQTSLINVYIIYKCV